MALLDMYFPPILGVSARWKHWLSIKDLYRCVACQQKHGQIYYLDEMPEPKPPLHERCRCEIKEMEVVQTGDATKDGQNGADWWIKKYGTLPEYYITMEDIEALGWRRGKSPSSFAPDQMIMGGIYRNDDGHLPDRAGRTWYEADINYYSGKRNGHRIVWSNDGLVFVTYDHYKTFYEVY